MGWAHAFSKTLSPGAGQAVSYDEHGNLIERHPPSRPAGVGAHGVGASGAGGEREPPRLAQLEAILDELNRRVYKPMARGWAASARKAVRPESATSKSASAWAQRPGAALWDTFGQAWSLHDIALFEAAFALYGKDFEAIQRVVSSKTTREIVNFFYLWKMTSHYRVYKVKATARADRAKASAMAAAMAAATAAAGKKAVTSKHPLSTFWGSHKNSKGKNFLKCFKDFKNSIFLDFQKFKNSKNSKIHFTIYFKIQFLVIWKIFF